MFFPAFNDNIRILVYYLFYLFIVIRFDSYLFRLFKLSAIPSELSHTSIALHMYMKWFVFFTIKEERKTIKPKYLRHKIFALLLLRSKYRNYFRYPQAF